MQMTSSPFTETIVPQGRPAKMMSFSDALSSYFSRAFDYSGRSTRSEYWWAYLGVGLMSALVNAVLGVIEGINGELSLFFSVIGLLVGIALGFPWIALFVRRMHDLGKSGWWLLMIIIPFAAIFLIILCMMDGEPTANIYGPVPTNKLV